MLRSWIILGLLLLCPSLAHADAKVDLCAADDQAGAGTNLASALAAGGRITFNCGGPATIQVHCTHVLLVDTQIDGGGNVTLQGNARVPGCGGVASSYSMFLNTAPRTLLLQLSNLHIAEARPKVDGVSATLQEGNVVRGNFDLSLSQVTIASSYAPILIKQGQAQVERSEFTGSAGSVIVAPQIAVSDHSKFIANGGSPLQSLGGSVTIADTEFSGNQQVSDLSQCTTILIRNSQFNGNVGNSDGGALRVDCSAQIIQSTFTNNRAARGGAIYIGRVATHTTLTGVSFNGNTAAADGGAVAMHLHILEPTPTHTLELHHVNFSGNGAQNGGGLAFIHSGATGIVSGEPTLSAVAVQFSDNQATVYGGALVVQRARVRLSRAVFSGNHATGAGGAVFGMQLGDGGIELANSLLVKNVSPGGASFAGNGATFINTTVADNKGPAISGHSGYIDLFLALHDLPHPPLVAALGLPPQPIRFQNAIVAGGTAVPCAPAGPDTPYQDLGNNLQYPGISCGTTIPAGAPQFGPSYIPLPTSPAASAGNDAVCAATPVGGRDIWGTPRPNGGAHCTIGAAETDVQKMVEQALAPILGPVSSVLSCGCLR